MSEHVDHRLYAPLELHRRMEAVEREYESMRTDILKYTEHCIALMKAVTELAVIMQNANLDTKPAAVHMQPKH